MPQNHLEDSDSLKQIANLQYLAELLSQKKKKSSRLKTYSLFLLHLKFTSVFSFKNLTSESKPQNWYETFDFGLKHLVDRLTSTFLSVVFVSFFIFI